MLFLLQKSIKIGMYIGSSHTDLKQKIMSQSTENRQ